MTFEEWIAQDDNRYLAEGFEITYHSLHRAWNAAIESERERCAEIDFGRIIGVAMLFDDRGRFDNWMGNDAKEWKDRVVAKIISEIRSSK